MANKTIMQKWTVCTAVIVALVVLVAALAVAVLVAPATQTAQAEGAGPKLLEITEDMVRDDVGATPDILPGFVQITEDEAREYANATIKPGISEWMFLYAYDYDAKDRLWYFKYVGFKKGEVVKTSRLEIYSVDSFKFAVWASLYGYLCEHRHDDTVFEEWDSDNSLPTEPGNYYLTKDVTIDGAKWVVDSDIKLCLNGHKVSTINLVYPDINAIVVEETGNLTICDCDKTAHYYDLNDNGVAININENSGMNRRSFVGGYILGGSFGNDDNSSPIAVNGGSLTWNAGSVVGSNGGVINVYKGSFTMNGGYMVGNYGTFGIALIGRVDQTTVPVSFVMNGGVIANNVGGYGGAVVVRGEQASFTMNGGSIANNTAKAKSNGANVRAGGVWVDNNATMVMNGGEIYGNTTDGTGYVYGGGIALTERAALTVNDGTIRGNSVSNGNGGGICSEDFSSLTINGGTITDNYARSGGGIFSGYGHFSMRDCTVKGNRALYEGGGIHTGNPVEASGEIIIEDNTLSESGEVSNYQFYYSQLIQIVAPLTGKTHIGVFVDDPSKGYVFTSDDAEAYLDMFSSDKEGYIVTTGANNALTLYAHTHVFTYTAAGDTITAVCSAENCPDQNKTATLTISASTVAYDGTAKAAGLSAYNHDAFAPEAIKYYKSGNEIAAANVVNAGTYVAKVTSNGKTAQVEFSIAKADLTENDYEIPTDLEATYGDTIASVTLPSGWTWVEEGSTKVGNVGNRTHSALYTPADSANYNTVTQTLSIAVAKADPAYTVPTGIEAAFGKVLGNVALPTGWSWQTPAESVGNEAGDKVFKATFTPDDTANYNIISDVDVTVNVHDHWHTFDYTVSGAVITATCNNKAECPYEYYAVTLTVEPNYNLVYDGNEKWVVLEYAEEAESVFEPITVAYYKNGVSARPTDVGTYVAKVTSNGVTAEVEFTISPSSFDDYTLTLTPDTLTYTGVEQAVSATVLHKNGGIPVQEDTAYTLSGNKATEVGEYTLTITGIGNYSGTMTATYHVVPANIEGLDIVTPAEGLDDDYIYVVSPWATTNIHYWGNVDGGLYVAWPGEPMESLGNGLFRYQYPTLKNNDTAVFLIFNTDGGAEQTGDLKDSKDVALGSIYFVTAKAQGQDHASASFKSRSQLRATVTRVANRADVEKVEFGGNTLTVDVDYTVSYKTSAGVDIAKPTLPGDYIVVVTGTGNYTGVVENEFTLTHAHDFTYTVDGATITATCGNPDCYVTEGLSLTLVAPTGDMVYDGNPRVATIAAGYNAEAFPDATIVYYKDDTIVTSYVAAGTYAAKVVMGDVAATVTFVIAKVNPDYDVPEGLTAIYGELLGTIALPDGWAWKNVNRVAGNAGTRRFDAVYTPADTANYNVISMALTVEVAKAMPIYAIPAIVADYGQTLADVSVPTGWSWADATADVGLVGVNTHKGIYTPIDTENYAVVDDIDVPVTVKWVLSNEKGSVRIDGDDEFDINVQVKVEIKTDIETKTKKSDYGKAAKKGVSAGEKIAFVYEVKLLRTTIVGGVETLAEIQPSDIKPGTTIEVSMGIPEALRGKAFKVLHIHSNTDAEFVDYTVSKDGKYLTVTTNRLSDFAFVVDVEAHGFCIGWIVFIFVMLLLLYTALYLIVWLPQTASFAAKCKLDKVKEQRSKMVLWGFVNLLLLIGVAASCAIWIFALVALCVHVCPVTIVCFVLATLILIFYGLILWCEWAKSKKVKGGKKAEPKAEEESPATATDSRDQAANASKTIPAATPVVGTSSENDIVATNDADEDDEEGGVVVDTKGNYFNIRYSKSFLAKLIQSPDEAKGYYGELKNEVLSYKKTKSRVSWAYDSVNAGRAPVVKFGIRGKTLCVYFALNADDYADTKYKVEKVESKKYEAVPCMYRIKNERRLGYAKDLIAAVAAQLGLAKGIVGTEDYYLPYESTEALIGKGLIKELKLAATTTQIERAKAEGTIKVVAHVEASEVNALVSDEVAAAAIQVADTESVHAGKKGIVNVDTLSLHFADGDTVTIEKLKEMKLIPAKYGKVKLLARGRLDKKLHVELQDFSIEAVKMVLLTGGTVKKV